MRCFSRLVAAAALGLPAISFAGPADYVYYPSVEYGEREIDFKVGTSKLRDRTRRAPVDRPRLRCHQLVVHRAVCEVAPRAGRAERVRRLG